MSKIISQSETTASRYDAGASSMEWRPLIAIDANVQMKNPNDEAMFDETTMVDDDEVMAKSKATVQPKPSWFDDDDYIVQSLNGKIPHLLEGQIGQVRRIQGSMWRQA
ncbi:unnamed protein product [Malus baccata var. baccata]